MIDWLNIKELIGCILVEQALGSQYKTIFLIHWTNNVAFRKAIVDLRKTDEYPERWAKNYSRLCTAVAVIMLYIAGDFLFNIF